MWTYYLFMALLIATMVLWGIVALRDDGQENGNSAQDTVKNDRSTNH